MRGAETIMKKILDPSVFVMIIFLYFLVVHRCWDIRYKTESFVKLVEYKAF